MIARLTGVLLEKQAPYLVVDVQGVGYELQAPMTTFYSLPTEGDVVELFTHFSVSETAQQLFGFSQRRERDLFRILIKVNGVGPKMAIAILSGMSADDLVVCVRDEGVASLTKVPGVGKKTAERLVIELRDKLIGWQLPETDLFSENATSSAGKEVLRDVRGESESALLALGYKSSEASRLIQNALKLQPNASAEELIRLALRSMVSR